MISIKFCMTIELNFRDSMPHGECVYVVYCLGNRSSKPQKMSHLVGSDTL